MNSSIDKKMDNASDNNINDNTGSNKMHGFTGKIIKKLMTREVITYLISGVLTTLVNWVLYYLICELGGMEELTGNAADWIITVAFAYIINAFWVFEEKFVNIKTEAGKVLKFYGARLATFIIEEGGLLVFVKWLDFNGMFVKIVLTVVVIVLNYVFSKLFVFRKNKNTAGI